MGSYEFPCPSCGQGQRIRAPNGSNIQAQDCAACREEKEKAAIENDHQRAKEKNGKAARH
jgi:hypothetical protein